MMNLEFNMLDFDSWQANQVYNEMEETVFADIMQCVPLREVLLRSKVVIPSANPAYIKGVEAGVRAVLSLVIARQRRLRKTQRLQVMPQIEESDMTAAMRQLDPAFNSLASELEAINKTSPGAAKAIITCVTATNMDLSQAAAMVALYRIIEEALKRKSIVTN